jgi:hypothetical protein
MAQHELEKDKQIRKKPTKRIGGGVQK